MSMFVGNKGLLIERVKHQKNIWMNKDLQEFFRTQRGLIVRAVNFGELSQLVEEGPENFLFHKGANFRFGYEDDVNLYARYRSGTVVVSPFEAKDRLIGLENPDGIKKIWIYGGQGHCLRDFRAPVELYNVRGFKWEQLRDLKNIDLWDNDMYL